MKHFRYSLTHTQERAERSRRGGQALIGLLAVVLILLGLYFLFLGPRRDSSGEARKSVARESIDRAKETGGTNYIGQIQIVIQQYRDDNEGKPPASLEELKRYAKFPDEMWVEPVTKQPLVYDPQTGTISSPPQSILGAGTAAPGSAAAPGSEPIPPAPPGLNVPDMQPKVPVETEP